MKDMDDKTGWHQAGSCKIEDGRCQLCEEFHQEVARKANREKIRKRRERRANKPRRRGDTGRVMER